MSFRPIYEGWDIPGRISRSLRRSFFGLGLSKDTITANSVSKRVQEKLHNKSLDNETSQQLLVHQIAEVALTGLCAEEFKSHPLFGVITEFISDLVAYEAWFVLPEYSAHAPVKRSELWEMEDQIKRVEAIIDNLDHVSELTALLTMEIVRPLVDQCPQILDHKETDNTNRLSFESRLIDILPDLADTVEQIFQVPFAPELDELDLVPNTRERLEYNLHLASGGVPGEASSVRSHRLPSKQSGLVGTKLIDVYLAGTPLLGLLALDIPIDLPQETRFEHHHIVAGSGHGKTQTLQHLILHDLDQVAEGKASIVVIDSQSDLINNIARLEAFAPGRPLADQLVLIDPTDIEWPVALNLFDVGMDRLDQYSQLDRERLTNSILELYDFVLGSLLDAGMTQKQTVIFRYITRLLLHIPNATIHTLRELLEDGGYDKYEKHIRVLQGSARAFFENEFNSKEFKSTKTQVLRRLYGILENQTFERMFSHPKSKLDLFSEMNAGKVILINTAKDLLKENGTQILGRFFIAMIAQAAQERATLDKKDRLPSFVYVDEANDYFDRNIGIILSQARKYNVGMILAHQFLGQLDAKLQESMAANTSIKFAGGVSAKDARALANDLRTEAGFIERQTKLSFAAFIKGETQQAASIAIEPGQLEGMPRMSDVQQESQRENMRQQYAVHYSELHSDVENQDDSKNSQADEDDGEPDVWE